MTAVFASAPGKVVLCGEYAVLDGAPAISMAVDRRATVKVSDANSDWHCVSAPGYSSLEGRFVSDGATIDWLQGGDEYRLVDAVWRTVGHTGNRYLSIELDTRAFLDDLSGSKIGVGSSAALVVALVAALGGSSDVLDLAIRSHRSLQRGAGSGIDIATGVSGGLIEYRMSEAAISQLRWPSGLSYRLVWTGVSASTGAQLERLQLAGRQASRDALACAAETMAKAWRSASAVMSEYPAYIETLRQFSVDHDLGIFDAGHDELVTEAAAAGLVYKPCGAGGGDVGILLGTSDEQLDDFIIRREAWECQVLKTHLEPRGVEMERH